jgi:ubiquinone/menaquinone biosynthesis C-methylase UbiE
LLRRRRIDRIDPVGKLLDLTRLGGCVDDLPCPGRRNGGNSAAFERSADSSIRNTSPVMLYANLRPNTFLVLLLLSLLLASTWDPVWAKDGPHYRYQQPSRDGIGKVYFGREISQVMGHRGARWLERKTRENEERPDRVIDAMALAADAEVADIGAGTGYFSVRLARAVPEGQVFAVDIQPEMLALLRARIDREGLRNITLVQGREDDPRLAPNSLDAALLVDAYHEFAYPYEMMRALVTALRPGGRVILIEYRGEDPSAPIKPLHKMTEAQAILEMDAVGLTHKLTLSTLPTQHILIFEKPGAS